MSKILSLIPTMQSTAILSENVKLAKKKNKKLKDFMGTGVKTITGIKLTSITADIIGSS